MSRIKMLTLAVLGGFLMVGCLSDDPTDDAAADATDDAAAENEVTSDLTCSVTSSTYTPFSGTSSTGAVSKYGWKGYNTTYPTGDEDFRTYGLPTTVECSSNKSQRSHLDVTAGCLTAVNVGGYSRGRITSTSDGAFRAVALPFASGESHPLKWTDQSNEYRFYYTGTSGPGTDPGFKAFIRYRTENDLYVASWRMDGLVNIKRKHCGAYTTLAQVSHAKPSTGTWHTIKFTAIGSRLDLYLDGSHILSTTDTTFSWGTSGIRTDAMTGAYLDEWKIAAP